MTIEKQNPLTQTRKKEPKQINDHFSANEYKAIKNLVNNKHHRNEEHNGINLPGGIRPIIKTKKKKQWLDNSAYTFNKKEKQKQLSLN